ncbi:Chitin synthase, class 2 [Terramyces sp. JEL0728]|nr:Chitin synthase, class 2 [Terramyces sp. JEL0728]
METAPNPYQNFPYHGSSADVNHDNALNSYYYPETTITVNDGDVQIQNRPVMYRTGTRLNIYSHKESIKLTEAGNFVIEVPVPKMVEKVASELPNSKKLRYTAVVGDPNDFEVGGYTLRQSDAGYTTEIFIVVTMYNEDQNLFLKTWKSLQKNIHYLCSKRNSKVWGANGWQKIVVCIVSDGRAKINSKTLAVLGLLGVYQDGLIKTSIEDKPVAGHLFEYTTYVELNDNYEKYNPTFAIYPVQVMFLLKENNAKKINSHRWFFNAFGPLLNPEVCILVDVGTKPTDKSIYFLWKEFNENKKVAGACGEIYAEQGKCGVKLLNPLVAAQNFEYKMSNILDKPLESVFGFIAVLPGAFSAYRYTALQNGKNGEGPLEKYFIGEKMHGGANLVKANMYLAEDRILCFELVTKRNEAWILRYVDKAKAETDVPDNVPEYVSQRRRWLNGSFFAGLHAIIHSYQIFRTRHTIGRKFALLIQSIYNLINLILNWFSIGSFYLMFTFLMGGVLDDPTKDPFHGYGEIIMITFKELYIFSILMIFVASLGNRPQGSRIMYTFSFILFAILMVLMLYVSIFQINLSVQKVIAESQQYNPQTGTYQTNIPTLGLIIAKEEPFRDLVITFLSTYGVYIISSIIYLDPWHMFHSFLQYMLLVPSFVNILMVYAFCNLHDVSWGTKGDNAPAESAQIHVSKDEKGRVSAKVGIPQQGEIDYNFTTFLDELKRPEEKTKGSKRSQDDYFKSFRTKLVLIWMVSNILLIAFFTTPEIEKLVGIDVSNVNVFNPFLTFYLWAIAGLSLFRFIGSVQYKIGRIKKSKK